MRGRGNPSGGAPAGWHGIEVGSLIVMRGRVVSRGPRGLMLASVVTGLLIGLVGMHHLSIPPEAPAVVPASSHIADPDAPTRQPGSPHDGGGHDSALLHLCLAILAAVALFMVSAVLWRQSPLLTTAPRPGRSGLRTAPRAPPPTAPARLALLCVLRT